MSAETERLRLLLGEAVPSGGTEDDTLFTTAQLQEIYDEAGAMEPAALKGWEMKAAALANLVNTNESGASRSLSQLHKNALEMVKYYGGGQVGTDPDVSKGRVKIHRIERADYT